VELLLGRGADPHLRGTYGMLTALQLAALEEPRFIPLLRPRFEPLDIFHAAALGEEGRVVELLNENPSLASARDENQWTALHYCAGSVLHRKSWEMAETLAKIARHLLAAGADLMAAWNFNHSITRAAPPTMPPWLKCF